MKVKKKAKAKKAVKKAADVNAARIGKTIGKNSGLGVGDAWSKLFKGNSKAKKTDQQLLAAMKADFPKREYFQPVGRLRSHYNRGVCGLGNPPGKKLPKDQYSVAYDAKGKPTENTNWDAGGKPDKKLSELARKRALKQWKGGKGKKTSKPAKPAKKAAAKKKAAKPAPAKKAAAKPAVKLKVKKAA